MLPEVSNRQSHSGSETRKPEVIDLLRNINWALPGLNRTTTDQIFYISFGQAWCTKKLNKYQELQFLQDSHAPERFRVLGKSPTTLVPHSYHTCTTL